jgi:hypothetical protein
MNQINDAQCTKSWLASEIQISNVLKGRVAHLTFCTHFPIPMLDPRPLKMQKTLTTMRRMLIGNNKGEALQESFEIAIQELIRTYPSDST